MKKGLEGFLVEAAQNCTHSRKVDDKDPEGGTLCLGCATLAFAEFYHSTKGGGGGKGGGEIVTSLPPPQDRSGEHPLEWPLR